MTGVTQLFEASSAYQVLVLAAAIDAGAFGTADQRILLTSANAQTPEVARRLERDPALDALLTRFDRVASYNDLIAPLHPSAFRPRIAEQVLFRRMLLRALEVPDDHTVELAVESAHVPPGRSLINVFGTSPVTVYAEGLMSYGPTRDRMSAHMTARLQRLLYLDLVPGLVPMLLTEYGVPSEPIDEATFRGAVRELRRQPQAADPAEPYALVLGQYLSELHILGARREAELQADLIGVAARAGLRSAVFKPHPSAPPHHLDVLERRAHDEGVSLRINRESLPVEAIYESAPPAMVLGCFSTGLVTAARYWSIPAVCSGVDEVLGGLALFENSNRIPLTIVDRTVPRVGPDLEILPPRGREAHDVGLQRVLEAVGYCMQWRSHERLREATAQTLRDDPAGTARYLTRRRLRELALPGGWPIALSTGAFRRVADASRWGRMQAAAARSVGARVVALVSPERLRPDPDLT